MGPIDRWPWSQERCTPPRKATTLQKGRTRKDQRKWHRSPRCFSSLPRCSCCYAATWSKRAASMSSWKRFLSLSPQTLRGFASPGWLFDGLKRVSTWNMYLKPLNNIIRSSKRRRTRSMTLIIEGMKHDLSLSNNTCGLALSLNIKDSEHESPGNAGRKWSCEGWQQQASGIVLQSFWFVTSLFYPIKWLNVVCLYFLWSAFALSR